MHSLMLIKYSFLQINSVYVSVCGIVWIENQFIFTNGELFLQINLIIINMDPFLFWRGSTDTRSHTDKRMYVCTQMSHIHICW